MVTTSQKTTVPILVYTHTCRCDSANSEAQRRAAVGSAMVCTAGLGVLMIPLNSLLEAAVSRLPWVVEQAVTGGVLGGVSVGVHYGCGCVCAQHGCLQYVVCVCVCVCVDHVPRCAGWCVSPCSLRLVASLHSQYAYPKRHENAHDKALRSQACRRYLRGMFTDEWQLHWRSDNLRYGPYLPPQCVHGDFFEQLHIFFRENQRRPGARKSNHTASVAWRL